MGAYLNDQYSENLIVALATAIAVLDVFFILVAVPESLPEKVRPSSWGTPISWEQADPFAVSYKKYLLARPRTFARKLNQYNFIIFSGPTQSWIKSNSFNAMRYSIIIILARSWTIFLHICLFEIENAFQFHRRVHIYCRCWYFKYSSASYFR